MKSKISTKDLEHPDMLVDRNGIVTHRQTGAQIGQLNVTPDQLASLLAFKAIQKAMGPDARTTK